MKFIIKMTLIQSGSSCYVHDTNPAAAWYGNTNPPYDYGRLRSEAQIYNKCQTDQALTYLLTIFRAGWKIETVAVD